MAGVNLTPKELAARLHISTGTAANWRVTGHGPEFLKFGKRVLYPLEAVETWEQEHRHSSVHIKANPNK